MFARQPQQASLALPSRRQVLKSASAGFGYLALAGLLGERGETAAGRQRHAARGRWRRGRPIFRPRPSGSSSCSCKAPSRKSTPGSTSPSCRPTTARSGRAAGRSWPRSSSSPSTARRAPGSRSCFRIRPQHVDKLCFLRGLHTDTPAHPEAVMQLHTGTAIVSLTRPSMGAWLMYGLGTREPGPARLHHDQPAAEFWRRGQLWQRVPAGPLPGDAASTTPAICRTSSRNCPRAAAQAARPGPGHEPRPGRAARRAGRARRRDRVVRAGLQDAGRRARTAGHFPRAASRARGLRREARPGGQLCPAVPDGPAAERGGRAVRRNLPGRLGPPQQFAQGADQQLGRWSTSRPRPCWPIWSSAACWTKRWCCSAASLAACRRPRARTAATTTSPAIRCGWPAPASSRAISYGSTDEYGIHAVEGRMHINDLHATLLALMGLDHESLTYRYAGRDFRLTDVAGNVVRDVFA